MAKINHALYLGAIDQLHSLFQIEGKEIRFSLKNDNEYTLLNKLKINASYAITILDDMVIHVSEEDDQKDYKPLVTGVPGLKTIKNLLSTALEPVGTTLYVYGGGWNWQDTGASMQTRDFGVAKEWIEFFHDHDETYTYIKPDPYNQYYYAGLDCSGYVGWVLYNTLETEKYKQGYVCSASKMARRLAEKGLGEISQIMHAGDIISLDGHVYISLGSCLDGSHVILHSTPSNSYSGFPGGGVQISAIGENKQCQAYLLADQYMKTYYPLWSQRYPAYLCDPGKYLSSQEIFSWHVLSDPDDIRNMHPDQILKTLFNQENQSCF